MFEHDRQRAGGGGPELLAPDLRLVVDTGDTEAATLTSARLLIIADVVARLFGVLHPGAFTCATLELRGNSPMALADLTSALWIREPLLEFDRPICPRSEGSEPALVLLTCEDRDLLAPSAQRLLVGRVDFPSAEVLDEPPLLGMREPLALRLALLRFLPGEPAVLTHARLNRAEETLHRWRFKVAGWAEMPPAPSPSRSMAAMYERLTSELDTRAVMTALHRIEIDPKVPSGAKFSIFTSFDRILGVDVCRLVGKVHR
jgi:hypothetical protein